jgi:CheY-like chemotaxis protein
MANALVIDDNRQMASSVCEMLKVLGVTSNAVYGPRDAIIMAQKNRPDIVFLDINMPGVDGFEVLSYLKRMPGLSDVPVIIVTSDDQPETAEKARSKGAMRLIIKPLSFDELEKILQDTQLI